MRISLAIVGGLGPMMNREYVVESAALDEPSRRALSDAISAASEQPQLTPNEAARDARTYTITIASDSGVRTLVAYDGAMPPETRKLITMIKTLAKA
jgi:emfourin